MGAYFWGLKFGDRDIIWGLKIQGLKWADLGSEINGGRDCLGFDIFASPKIY